MQTVLVVIETPKGKGQKYDYDLSSGYFKLKKVMPAGLVFPFDFGYIPGTEGGDGDPLDAMVISELETFSGCAVDCRIIGAVKASQKERDGERMRNDRVIAIPEVSVQFAGVKRISDLPNEVMDQLEAFFKNYNQQAGKSFSPLGRMNPAQATAMISDSRTERPQTIMIQLFLPVKDQNGKPFAKSLYRNLNVQLLKKFGGLTVYARSVATGFWENDNGNKVKEEVLIYEVMTAHVEEKYWKKLKSSLQEKFSQQEIMIISSQIALL
jgi:inorganic pyrophosphatase